MSPIRSLLIAASALAATVSASSAQEEVPAIEGIIAAWVEEQVPDFAPVVKDYGTACLISVIAQYPDEAIQTIVDSGGMEAGLAAIDADDPAMIEPYFDSMQDCVEAVVVGGQMIWSWVVDEYRGDPVEELEAMTVCFMSAVEPLSSEAKGLILQGLDFEDGAELVLQDAPEQAVGFEDQLEACD